jgi:hypothetical protein
MKYILYDAEKQVLFLLLPLMVGKFELLEADEFEHAVTRSCSGDHCGDGIPIVFGLDE